MDFNVLIIGCDYQPAVISTPLYPFPSDGALEKAQQTETEQA